jgi:acyl dehydratase
MDVQAIYKAVRKHVGRSFQRDIGQLRSMDMQRFAVAVGDDLPITMNVLVAAEAGLPDVVAPPLFLSAVMGWDAGPAESGLLADGVPPGGLADLPVGGLRLMGGGQSLEFLQPVVAGTRIVQETRVKDVQLKEGRSGPLLLIQVERLFFGDGELLLRCVETFIGR